MANEEHLAELLKGVEAWNKWREENPKVRPDFRGANINEADLRKANFRRADFKGADLTGADIRQADLADAYLRGVRMGSYRRRSERCDTPSKLGQAGLKTAPYPADLRESNLKGANLSEADLRCVDLRDANLSHARLDDALLHKADLSGSNLSRSYLGASLTQADLSGATLTGAYLNGANLWLAKLRDADLSEVEAIKANFEGADLRGATLRNANLHGARFIAADLSNAKLLGSRLTSAVMVGTDLTSADLTSCSIHGLSAWDVTTREATQKNLLITKRGAPEVHVDELEVAQFVYLLLNRSKLRSVLGTITSKAVLLLGRFTPGRKAILDAMANELRKHDLLPIIFDFKRATSLDFTETIRLLAGLSLFVIADLTKPKSVPQELQAMVPDYQKPFILIIQKGEKPYSMLRDFSKYDWVLKPVLEYTSREKLLAGFKKKIIDRAWEKHKAIQHRKNLELETESIEDYMEGGVSGET